MSDTIEVTDGAWTETSDMAYHDEAFVRLLELAGEARRNHNLGWAGDLAAAAERDQGDSEDGFRQAIHDAGLDAARVRREVALVRERAERAMRTP